MSERQAEDSLDPSSSTEEVNAFRNRLQIKVKGAEVPSPCATFSAMQISKGMKQIILENIEKSAWKEPTAIQMQVIPCMLMGRDVLATAPTGSGRYLNLHTQITSIISMSIRLRKNGGVCDSNSLAARRRLHGCSCQAEGCSGASVGTYERASRANIPRNNSPLNWTKSTNSTTKEI